jgi:hypothetical protein
VELKARVYGNNYTFFLKNGRIHAYREKHLPHNNRQNFTAHKKTFQNTGKKSEQASA